MIINPQDLPLIKNVYQLRYRIVFFSPVTMQVIFISKAGRFKKILSKQYYVYKIRKNSLYSELSIWHAFYTPFVSLQLISGIVLPAKLLKS